MWSSALAPVAGLALAAVFAIAASIKLADRATTTREFTDLGLPKPSLLARIVPPAELIVAVALITRPAVGAVLAALALLAFSAVLISVLRTGRSVSCGCLGAMSQRPVTMATVARNGALLALAAIASTGPDPRGFAITVPAAEVAMATGTAALIGLVGFQLVTLRNQIGRCGRSSWPARASRTPPRPIRSSASQPLAWRPCRHRGSNVMNGSIWDPVPTSCCGPPSACSLHRRCSAPADRGPPHQDRPDGVNFAGEGPELDAPAPETDGIDYAAHRSRCWPSPPRPVRSAPPSSPRSSGSAGPTTTSSSTSSTTRRRPQPSPGSRFAPPPTSSPSMPMASCGAAGLPHPRSGRGDAGRGPGRPPDRHRRQRRRVPHRYRDRRTVVQL